jgi:phosphoribosylaminoimidazole-succinocarboxamide synthase
MLIDEVHTPDSSRFWKADSYAERAGARAKSRRISTKNLCAWRTPSRATAAKAKPPKCPPPVGCRQPALHRDLRNADRQRFLPGDYPVEPRLEESTSGRIL